MIYYKNNKLYNKYMNFKKFFSLFVVMFFLTTPVFVLAASCSGINDMTTCNATIGCTWSSGACGTSTSDINWEDEPIYTTIKNITDFFNIVGGAIVGLFIIIGGFLYASGGGNEKQLSTAKSMITCAVIGFVIIMLANVIIATVQKVIS